MMIIGVLIFAVLSFVFSFLIAKSRDFDKGKLAMSVTLIAWGSLIYGLYISRISH